MNKADFKGYFKNIQQTQEDVNTDEVWKMTKEHLKLMLGNRVFLSLFNDVYIGELSGNDIFSADFTHMRYGDYYYGYRLIYQLGKPSNVGRCE